MSEETVYYWLNIDGIEDVTNEHILKLMPTAETSYNYIRNYIKELTKDLVYKRPNDEALTITAMSVLNAHVDVLKVP